MTMGMCSVESSTQNSNLANETISGSEIILINRTMAEGSTPASLRMTGIYASVYESTRLNRVLQFIITEDGTLYCRYEHLDNTPLSRHPFSKPPIPTLNE